MGFRSLYFQEVDFDNPIFVVGRNGSGKSNFADAFAFLSEAMIQRTSRLAGRSMQVVVTTHSPDILDAKWIEDRHLRILTSEGGRTRIERPSRSVRTALRDHLMGAGELLRSNALTAEEESDRDSR